MKEIQYQNIQNRISKRDKEIREHIESFLPHDSPLHKSVKLDFQKQKSKGIKDDESLLCSTPTNEQQASKSQKFSPLGRNSSKDGPKTPELGGENFIIKLRNMQKNHDSRLENITPKNQE